jgi:hypothetical protein
VPTTPITLPERMYLISWDPDRRRFTGSGERDLLLRAAALADLVLAGVLRDADGRAVVVPGARPPADPFLAEVFAQVAARERPRRWQTWVNHRSGRATRLVRDRLAQARWVAVEPRRLLGIIPADRVTARDPRAVRRLIDAAAATLRAPRVDTVPETDAAAAALAAAAGLRTVLSRKEARARKERISALGERIAPVPTALRKAVSGRHAAAAS